MVCIYMSTFKKILIKKFRCYSHSEAGTYSPWWRPGSQESQLPWRLHLWQWPCWQLTVRGMRVRRWRSCPATQRARCPRQAVHSHITARQRDTTDGKVRNRIGSDLFRDTETLFTTKFPLLAAAPAGQGYDDGGPPLECKVICFRLKL